MSDKTFWIGLSVRVMAENEEEASRYAGYLAHSVLGYGDVVESRWDNNNLPEQEWSEIEEEQE